MHAEYEDLLIRFESQVVNSYFSHFSAILASWVPLFSNLFIVQRTESEIRIDCLTRKLAEANAAHYVTKSTTNGDRNVGTREAEAILVIKRLQEQVAESSLSLSLSQYSSLLFCHLGKSYLFNALKFLCHLICNIFHLKTVVCHTD